MAIYDYDGATSYPLGKVYDYDGATSYPIYTAEEILVGTDVGDPSTLWTYKNDTVTGSDDKSHTATAITDGTAIRFRRGDNYAGTTAYPEATTKTYYDFNQIDKIRVVGRIQGGKAISVNIRLYNESNTKVLDTQIYTQKAGVYSATAVRDLSVDVDTTGVSTPCKIIIRCGLGDSYSEGFVWIDSCIIE